MGAVKRELERLGEIIVYGNLETLQRELGKLLVYDKESAAAWIAQVIEMSRIMAPLCECGADYHSELMERNTEHAFKIDRESAAK
jgi:hypothetical protein